MLFKQTISKLLLGAILAITVLPTASARPHFIFENPALEASALTLITGSVIFCFKEKYDVKKHGERSELSFSKIKDELITALKNHDIKALASMVNKYAIGREDDGSSLGAFLHSLWKKAQGPVMFMGVLAALNKSDFEAACKEGRFSGLISFVSSKAKSSTAPSEGIIS